MKIAKEPGLLLEVMKTHEEVISRLYECYAERFPEHRNFWTKLSKEEIEHANWIDRLRSRIEEGSDAMVVDRFPIAAVKSSIDFVNKQIDKALDANFSLINALSTAIDIEKALLESAYFETFEGDSKETIRTLAFLASSTREHRRRIGDMLQECK